MQDYNTIIGVIQMRLNECPFSVIESRYRIGSGTVQRILERFNSSGFTLEQLKTMEPDKVEGMIYPPEKLKRNQSAFSNLIKVLYGVVILVYLVGLSWVFPLQAKFENSVKNTIKNAFIIGISRIGKSIVIAILLLIPVLMAVFFTKIFILTGFVWILCGFSVIAVLQSLVINTVFSRYTVSSLEHENREDS